MLQQGSNRRYRLFSISDPVGFTSIGVLGLWAIAGYLALSSLLNVPQLKLTRDEWVTASIQWLSEPSGIATLTEDVQPLLLGVDDEEPGVFVIQLLADGGFGVRRILHFDDLRPKDLEGIAYDQLKGKGVAITSHRRIDDDTGDQRLLIKFRVPDDWSTSPEGKLKILGTRNVAGPLEKALAGMNITLDNNRWSQRNRGNPEYEVEIEGLAYRDDVITLGLRWPLDNGNAILLDYDFSKETFGPPRRLPSDGAGISALTWIDQDLYVAVNPPVKEDPDVHCDSRAFGRSALFAVPNGGTPRPLTQFEAASRCAKLEGITRVGDALVGAYDGETPSIKPIPCGYGIASTVAWLRGQGRASGCLAQTKR